jgi:hypothetical protein
MSRFQRARENFKEKVFGSSSSTPASSEGATESEVPAEGSKEEQDVAKKERGLKSMLKHARDKFIERGLEGSIEIYSLVTIFSHTISCEVSNESATAEETDEGEEPVEDSTSSRTTISMMDSTIRTLELRARGYKNSTFKDDVTLSSGIYVTMPLIGLASISVTFTATVKSLLASAERRAAAKAAEKATGKA